MAPPSFTKIDPTRVTPMSFPDRPPQALLRFRNHDHMHVVRHQAVSPNLHLPVGAPLGHQADVCLIVFFTEKSRLPAIAPLCDVMGEARRHHSCDPCHGSTLWERTSRVKIKYGVPGITNEPMSPDYPVTDVPRRSYFLVMHPSGLFPFQRLAHLAGKLVHGKWFLDEMHACVQHPPIGDDIGPVTGHKQAL